MKKGKRVVITYGTFDLFHIGHLNLLKRAKELGDYLIVGVSTDKFNELKGKKAFIPYQQRKEIIKAIKYVDLVIPEKSWNQKIKDIKKYDVDIFVIGDDWKGKFDYLNEYCKVIYLPRTKGLSSTEIRNLLEKRHLKSKVKSSQNTWKLLKGICYKKIKKFIQVLETISKEYLK